MKNTFGRLAIPLLAFIFIWSCKPSDDAFLGEIYNQTIPEFKISNQEKEVTLVDVRTPEEYNEGHLEGAVNVDWKAKTFRNYILNVPKEKPILIYCRSGNRSGKAASALLSLGFEKVYNLKKGFKHWKAENETYDTGNNEANIAFLQIAKSIDNDVAAAMAEATKKGRGEIHEVNSADFQQAMLIENITLVDVRTAEEFEEGHIPNAKNIDWKKRSFSDLMSQLDKKNPILIYCRSGNRSGKAVLTMQAIGFKNIYNLENGFKGWVANDLPVEK